MLFGNIRRDMHTDFQSKSNASYSLSLLPTPLSATSTITRTPTTPHTATTNYARMPHRYTTSTLLSLRPPPEVTIFPSHLVEERFLDEQHFIDLDRMLVEKAGNFDLESYNMREAPIKPRRVHKYDFSDPIVIEKVKNRRPKDPLTPQQVAALTSVATRHQTPATTSSALSSSSVWVDDYSHAQVQTHSSRHHLPPQPSLPYQRQNPNQCEIYTNQIKSLLTTYQPTAVEGKIADETNTIPILQRLFEAQRVQENQFPQTPKTKRFQPGLSAFCTPSTPQKTKSFDWFSSSEQTQKDLLTQLLNEHLRGSSITQTPGTPAMPRIQKDDDEQSFYSAPPSPTQQTGDSLSFFDDHSVDKSSFPTSLENWFGASIYKTAYPRMPSDRVLTACDLEQ